jgi:membrane protease YdiL (CAAX protease family)
MITLPVMVLFLMLGVITGYKAGGWPGVASRILNWHSLVAFACYLPWALAQQTLFQFYLLGRLLALFPKTVPFVSIAITGLAYSLVHLPDIWSTLVTAGAGVVWSWLYCRYRVLLPLAASHAALGTTFYYWVCGRDLFDAWRSSIA